MKQKEMLFDLESNELLELDQDGNPIEKTIENEEEIKQEDAQAKDNNQDKEDKIEEKSSENTKQSLEEKLDKPVSEQETEKLEIDTDKKEQNKEIDEPNSKKQEAKDMDFEFISTAKKSTGQDKSQESNSKATNQKKNKGKKNKNKNNANRENTNKNKTNQGKASNQNKQQKQGENKQQDHSDLPSSDSVEKQSINIEKQDINTEKIEAKIEPKKPTKQQEKASEQAEKIKEAAQNVRANVGKTAANLAKSSKPMLEKAGTQSKKIWASIQKGASNASKNIKKDFREGGIKRLIERNKMTILLGTLIFVIGIGLYAFQYQSLPKLSETRQGTAGGHYTNYDAEAHPMDILSTVRENMTEFKGDPSAKGDGKTDETRYLVYSMKWFGMNRKTVIYYDTTNTFNRVKLEIDNESAESLYEKLKVELGTPMDENTPTVKEGWAIWIKDSIKYKMQHRGGYTQLDMTIAKYDNSQNLPVGKYPIIIQNIDDLDLNGDKVMDEKIMLLGNRNSSTDISFSKIYLLVWDGKKTHLQEMDPEYDGGEYPQLEFADIDEDGTEEFVVSAKNSIVFNYNAFKYAETGLERVYSGYEGPKSSEQQAD